MGRWRFFAGLVTVGLLLSLTAATAAETAQDDDPVCVAGPGNWRIDVLSVTPALPAAVSDEGPPSGHRRIVVRLRIVNGVTSGMPWGTLPHGLAITTDGRLNGIDGGAEPQPVSLDAGAVLIDSTVIPPAFPLPGRFDLDIPEGSTPAQLLLVPGACGGERRGLALPAEGDAAGDPATTIPILGAPATLTVGALEIEQTGTSVGVSCRSTGQPRHDPMAAMATISFVVRNRSAGPVVLTVTGEVIDSTGARWPGIAVAGDGMVPGASTVELDLTGPVSPVVDAGDCENMPGFAPGTMWVQATFGSSGAEDPPTEAVVLLDLPGPFDGDW